MKNSLPENRFLRGGMLLVRRYWRHRVAVQGAALAFYLLFAVFPFLIFISALIGLLRLDAAALLGGLADFLPGEILALMERYLRYAAENSSLRLLLFGLVFSVYFPARAANTLMRAVRQAYGLGPPRAVVRYWADTLLYTVLFIAFVALTLMVLTASDRLVLWAGKVLGLPVLIPRLWKLLRFPLVAAGGYAALLVLYAVARDGHSRRGELCPGALAALAVWLSVSWGYRVYVERFAHYATLYGSIGAVIVLLIWLEITAVIFIMGAEWNGVLMRLGRQVKKP